MKEQYAVCYLQRGSDSGMSCHIERKVTSERQRREREGERQYEEEIVKL